MKALKTTLAVASLCFAGIATNAAADDKATVQTVYDLLSNPGSAELAEAFLEVTSEDWGSVGNYSGENGRTRDEFVGQFGQRGLFDQLIPDLDWSVQAMHQDGDFVTVRSRVTGTPTVTFLGVDGEGRSFDIMTIDIHELDDGVIVRTYSVGDWTRAVQQLSDNENFFR